MCSRHRYFSRGIHIDCINKLYAAPQGIALKPHSIAEYLSTSANVIRLSRVETIYSTVFSVISFSLIRSKVFKTWTTLFSMFTLMGVDVA